MTYCEICNDDMTEHDINDIIWCRFDGNHQEFADNYIVPELPFELADGERVAWDKELYDFVLYEIITPDGRAPFMHAKPLIIDTEDTVDEFRELMEWRRDNDAVTRTAPEEAVVVR